ALGRVLFVAKDIPLNHDAELIEARLNEAVLRELPALERGQSIIKLLAGIAPLLGLLGTVTGMIATFQAITTYGTGDAKLMAAGISQALITTVLGLIVAIPLLLMHNWVASRSRALVQVLDEQSAGLMAEALEKSNEKSHVA
ncbi:MAG: MotA/TolQ/ExbB proton channel family protein, partial [Thalassolituus oleivorans]|nr:MotA/TolQ/ExbB proton channel family protein [Thalassolituus oleivorans]